MAVVSSRRQGDLGEISAIEWLSSQGHAVYVPLGHSPHCDVIAEANDELLRVQVKTCAVFRTGRWVVTLCTRGGNRSWSGLVKRLDPSRIDYLFVLVADGRRWFIPATAIAGGSGILLGGPKYADFEVDAGVVSRRGRTSDAIIATPGGVPERSKGRDCKSRGSALAGSNPAPAILSIAPQTPRKLARLMGADRDMLKCALVAHGERERGDATTYRPGPIEADRATHVIQPRQAQADL